MSELTGFLDLSNSPNAFTHLHPKMTRTATRETDDMKDRFSGLLHKEEALKIRPSVQDWPTEKRDSNSILSPIK